eukprot:SAG25_NODE_100_length_15542_cov_15.293337_4_plen_249_part_00
MVRHTGQSHTPRHPLRLCCVGALSAGGPRPHHCLHCSYAICGGWGGGGRRRWGRWRRDDDGRGRPVCGAAAADGADRKCRAGGASLLLMCRSHAHHAWGRPSPFCACAVRPVCPLTAWRALPPPPRLRSAGRGEPALTPEQQLRRGERAEPVGRAGGGAHRDRHLRRGGERAEGDGAPGAQRRGHPTHGGAIRGGDGFRLAGGRRWHRGRYGRRGRADDPRDGCDGAGARESDEEGEGGAGCRRATHR